MRLRFFDSFSGVFRLSLLFFLGFSLLGSLALSRLLALSSEAAAEAAEKLGTKTHIGGIYSSDTFYDERPDLNEQMTRHGILGVEMEAAELYTLAARHGRRALAVLTVSDHLVTGEALPSADREQSFGDMVEIALEAAFA